MHFRALNRAQAQAQILRSSEMYKYIVTQALDYSDQADGMKHFHV